MNKEMPDNPKYIEIMLYFSFCKSSESITQTEREIKSIRNENSIGTVQSPIEDKKRNEKGTRVVERIILQTILFI